MKKILLGAAALGVALVASRHSWALSGGIDLTTGATSLRTLVTNLAGGGIATVGAGQGVWAAANHRSFAPAVAGISTGALITYGTPTIITMFGG